jgi:prophage tail gpP-like protein
VPKKREVATLIVGNLVFEDWETVWIQHRYGDAYAFFRFTCAEREPYPDRWIALRFKPDDPCLILLAGQIAMNGVIVTRQVAYDARRHGVELQGKSRTWWASKSSVESKTGSFDNQSFWQVFTAVLAPYPIGKVAIGELDPTPFKKLQANKGEKIWPFLERIARPRGIVLGSDHLGNMLAIDHHSAPLVESLIEGENILRCQCIISKDDFYMKYTASGQIGGTGKMMQQRSEPEQSVGGSSPIYSHLIVPAEQPVWNDAELKKRAASEALGHEGAYVEVHITVQGWTKTNGNIWRVGEVVKVFSPMIMMRGRDLAIETATFTQDASGTMTVLKLVLPELLKITGRFTFGDEPPSLQGEGTPPPPPPPEMPTGPPVEFLLPPGLQLDSSGAIVEDKNRS